MVIHVVQPGESAYWIARRYGVPVQRVVDDNALGEAARLTPGQALIIRQPAVVHTVRRGETLGNIAAHYGTTVVKLWQANPQLNGRDQIEAGQQLVISENGYKGVLAVNGYAYPSIDRTVLRRTLPYLTYLSVFSFGVGSDGGLNTIDDNGLPQLARTYGVVPLMVLTTLAPDGTFSGERAHALLNDEAAQQRLVADLRETMRARGYGGVDVDFEYLPPEDAERYAAFIRMLRETLAPEGYIVLVALAPKTSEAQRGLLYEAHRYPVLGAAADLALVMTYEWGYTYSAPMAVAPLDKVRRVLEYAVSVIPPRKIMMGVPNYGYDWTLPYVEGQSRARSLSNLQAVEQAIDRGAYIRYNQTAQTPFYNYWKDNAEHEVWFEDARSVQAKLALAHELALAGVSVWNIMRWFPQLWLTLQSEYAIKKLL